MAAQGGNVQRLPKRRLERTYRLDTRLAGLEVDGISVAFNKTFARDPLKDAQADEVRTRTAILKVEKGLISPDAAAQELGYDSAFDSSLMSENHEAAKALHAVSGAAQREEGSSITLRFDRHTQSYRYVPERIELV